MMHQDVFVRLESDRKCASCPASRNSLLCGLEPELKANLEGYIQSRSFVCGSNIFLEDEPAQAVYCLASGRVKLATGSSNGRGLIALLVGPSAILGVKDVLLEAPHDLTATAVEDCLVCILPKESFLEAIRHSPELSLRVARQMGMELSEICRRFSSAVCRPLSERLAELLLSLCQTHGEPTPYGIHLCTNLGQEELSELLGVSRRSLNRALAELRRLGLIRCSRRSILIPDSRMLCDWLAVVS